MANISKESGAKAKVESVVIDVTDDESIKQGVKTVEKKLAGKGLDVLIVSSLPIRDVNTDKTSFYRTTRE